ncbi:hypothetical protein XENOCAPTIV_026136 [Xenoophorus captivus]|uniref:Uncharacterized protein n=1 Tax=Xenoophorus captivus TaxID=1517983 RepID=A0ABV0RJL0_9TELE
MAEQGGMERSLTWRGACCCDFEVQATSMQKLQVGKSKCSVVLGVLTLKIHYTVLAKFSSHGNVPTSVGKFLLNLKLRQQSRTEACLNTGQTNRKLRC